MTLFSMATNSKQKRLDANYHKSAKFLRSIKAISVFSLSFDHGSKESEVVAHVVFAPVGTCTRKEGHVR